MCLNDCFPHGYNLENNKMNITHFRFGNYLHLHSLNLYIFLQNLQIGREKERNLYIGMIVYYKGELSHTQTFVAEQ